MSDTINVPEGRDLDKDLEVLSDAFFENLQREEYAEYGGWGLDDKRPFGNSSVEFDILEIIGLTPEEFCDENDDMIPEFRNYANDLYGELGAYLREKWLERKPKA